MASAPPRPSQPPVPKPRSGRAPKTEAPSYPPPQRPAEGPALVRPNSPPPRLIQPPKRKSVGDLETESARPPSLAVVSPPGTPRDPDVLPDGEYIPRQSSAEIAYEEPQSVQKQVRELQGDRSPPPGGQKERGEDDCEVQLRPSSGEAQSRGTSPEYADIDADLKRKSDYINVEDVDIDLEDSDEEVNAAGFTGYTIHGGGAGSGYAPSIKLHSHPALRKSLSSTSFEESTFGSSSSATPMAELIRQVKKRPKNRAPPPPPSSVATGGGDEAAAAGKRSDAPAMVASDKKPPSGHRRTKSAQLLDSGGFGEAGAEILADANRRSPVDDRHDGPPERSRYGGHLSPAPSPPPSTAAQHRSGRASPKQGQRSSPKLGRRSPKQGQSSSPKEVHSSNKSPKQHHRGTEGVVNVAPTPPPGDKGIVAAAHPPSNPSRPTPTAAAASGQVAKKQKAAIPSRPPPPPASGQHLKSGAPPPPSNQPSPHRQHHHGPPQPNKKAPSQVHGSPKELVRGRQPAATPPESRRDDGKRRSASALPSSNEVIPPRAQRSESAAVDSPSIKPKRHAPPPPTGRSPHSSPMQGRAAPKEVPPPNYAEVMRQDRSKEVGGGRGGASRNTPGVQNGGSRANEGGTVSEVGVVGEPVTAAAAPPKPRKTARAQSLDFTAVAERQATPTPPLSPSYDPYEEVLRTMDLLTIELRRGEESVHANLGLELVSGKVRSGLGVLAEGVFVRSIRRGSPAEQDGRIQPGDMLVEVSGCVIRSRLDSAHSLLTQSVQSVRVKVGRPDITSSIFSVQNGVEEPIYTNQLVGTTYDELLEKLERARVRADENEREKESALQELEAYRQEVQNDREALVKQLEETKRLFEEHKRESETRTTELTQTVASLSVSKTKSDSELEGHKEKLRELQDQLEQEKGKAEKDLLDIRQKLMETQEKLNQKDGELNNKRSESEQKIQELQDEIAKHKDDRTKMWTELVAEKERVTDLEERLKCAQADLAVEKEINAKTRKTLEEKDVEISQLQSEVAELRLELVEAKALLSSKETKQEVNTHHSKPVPAVPAVPARPCKPREPSPPVEVSTDAAPLSEEEIPLQENGEVASEEDSDKEDAFDKQHSPSPQVPCPYIDFVPLTMDSKEASPSAKSEGEENSRKKEGKQKEEESVEKDEDKGCQNEEEKKEEEPVEVGGELCLEEEVKQEGVASAEGDITIEEEDMPKGEEDSGCEVAGEEKAQEEEEEEEKEEEKEAVTEEEVTDSPAAEVKKVVTETEEKIVTGEREEEKEVPAIDTSGVESEEVVEGDEERIVEEPDREPSPDLSEVIKPHKVLDSSAVLNRSRISSVMKRKLPSREHLRKKDSRGDILHNMPEGMLSDLQNPLEEVTPEPEVLEKSVEESTAAKSSTPQPQPKPRPKAAPRKKPVAAPTDKPKEEKKVPLAAPRSRPSQDIVGDSSSSSPPMPDESSEHLSAALRTKKEDEAPPVASKPHPHVGPKPSPKRSGVPTPVPRPRTGSTEDSSAPMSPERKDPSKLSVREKALLAQKALMSTPDKPKPGGPPIPRKPKPTVPTPSESTSDSAQPVNETSEESLERGGPSTVATDGITTRASPVPKRKLPPGAFSIMGGVSVFGPPPTADRGRSYTTTSVDRSREEEPTSVPESRSQDASPAHGISEVDQKSDSQDAGLSPENPVLKTSIEEEGEGSADTSPVIEPKFNKEPDQPPPDTTDGAQVDLDVVLSWTPEVTAAWLRQVGLGNYQQQFLEKGIQGNMLFDIDGHKLKGMGVTSHDDRNIFKKEIKNLKPYADKQKKLIEKQKKEEKKQAKKKKK